MPELVRIVKNIIKHYKLKRLCSIILQNAEECDATKVDSSTEAYFTIINFA
jgi:hypothetical protein